MSVFFGFFELFYPFSSDYNKCVDESAFCAAMPKRESYISHTSHDYVDAQTLFDAASDLLKQEKTRLIKLFPEYEFELVFTPVDPESLTEGEEHTSLGVLTLVNNSLDDYVCHVELFSSDFDSDDFNPSFFFSSTIH